SGNGMLNLNTFSFSPQVLPGMIRNPSGFYIALTTSAAPRGALRGQLSRWVETLSAASRIENVTPQPSGLFMAQIPTVTIIPTRDIYGKIIRGSVSIANRYESQVIPEIPNNDKVSSLRIHEGAAGLNGPAVIDTGLSVADGFGASSGFINFTVSGGNADIMQHLVTNPEKFYFLLSTAGTSHGKIRQQFVSLSA